MDYDMMGTQESRFKGGNDNQDFGAMLEQRIQANFGFDSEEDIPKATNEKLKDMNKKLPDWDLEPPFTYLK